MKLMTLKVPQGAHQLSSIHPEHKDEDYLKSYSEGKWLQDADTNEVNKGFSQINEFKASLDGMPVEEMDSKISQIQGAIQEVDRSLEAQKFTRREHKVDKVMSKTCQTKMMLQEMLTAAKEARDKQLQEAE